MCDPSTYMSMSDNIMFYIAQIMYIIITDIPVVYIIFINCFIAYLSRMSTCSNWHFFLDLLPRFKDDDFALQEMTTLF